MPYLGQATLLKYNCKPTFPKATFPRLKCCALKDLPLYVDWREKNILPKDHYHGDASSCWAIAPIMAIEAKLAILTNGEEKVSLSVQQFLDCCLYTEDGGLPSFAFDYASLSGISFEEDYPWENSHSKPCREKKGKKVKISGYARVKPTELDLMHAVSQQPVVVTLCCGEKYIENKLGKDIYEEPCFIAGERIEKNHAVLLVGYRATDEGVQYWICMNSWTDLWGDKGFFYLRKDSLLPDGQCGILKGAMFPEDVFFVDE